MHEEKRGGEAATLRDILIQYGLERPQNKKRAETYVKRDFVASELAEDFNDTKSLGCYRAIVEKVPEQVIYEVRSAVLDAHRRGIVRKSRGALFVGIIQDYCHKHGIALGFQTEPTTSEVLP